MKLSSKESKSLQLPGDSRCVPKALYLNSYFSIFKESELGVFTQDPSQISYMQTGLPCFVYTLQTHPAKIGLLDFSNSFDVIGNCQTPWYHLPRSHDYNFKTLCITSLFKIILSSEQKLSNIHTVHLKERKNM